MEEKRKFKIGDVVKLASGGPDAKMTIAGYCCDAPMIGEDEQFHGLVLCHWFVGNSIHKENFHEDELVLVSA